MATEIHWCKITRSGLLRFEGSDAQSFLQGQLTSNVAALDAVHSQYTGYCTPKGRLLAAMLLWQHDGAYVTMLPRELSEPVRKRISMYILRAKVKAADVTAEHGLFGVAGAQAASLLARLAGSAPQAAHDVVHGDDVTAIKLPLNRFLLVAPTARSQPIEAMLTQTSPAQDETVWSAADIEAGIPTVFAATQEQFVPQTVNFDRIGAVAFDKGCYPGQEIVARTHFLGRVKQRMVRARLHSSAAVAPGDKLYSPAFGDQASGMIVNAVRTGADEHAVLAVIQASDIANAPIHCHAPAGPTLRIEPLPYPLD